jgi:uncharacterized membrane protein
MPGSALQYLPLAWPFFIVLVGIFFWICAMLYMGALRYVYARLGISPTSVVLLLLASLVGSYFNIPVWQLSGEPLLAGEEVDFYGMRYVVPVVEAWPGTVIAVNVGGAIVPAVVSLYLLVRHRLWRDGLMMVATVALVCNLLARPIPGLGIALPVFVPALTTTIAALLVSRRSGAPLAYIGGSLGTLIGADLLNLGSIVGLAAPVVSIGGAGTFDGIFLNGVLAMVITSLFRPAG